MTQNRPNKAAGSKEHKNSLLPPLVKKARDWLPKAVLALVNTMAGLALFPFSWKTFLIDLIFIVPGLCFAVVYFRAKTKKKRRKALCWGLIMSVCAYIWILLSPFILSKGPLYVGKGTAPAPAMLVGYGSAMHIMNDAEGNRIGTFLWITDPVRKSIVPLLETIFGNKVRAFPTSRLAGSSYVLLPVMTKTLMEQSEHGVSGTFNSLYFPMCTTETTLNIEGEVYSSYNIPIYTLGYGASVFALIDFA